MASRLRLGVGASIQIGDWRQRMHTEQAGRARAADGRAIFEVIDAQPKGCEATTDTSPYLLWHSS